MANHVFLMGRLTKDPEVRYTQGEKPVAIASFTLAVDRKFKKEGQPSADFINIKSFGKTAEVIEKYVTKGTKLVVTGSIVTGSYKNKDGNTVYTTDVHADSIEFCESRNAGNNSASAPNETPASDDGFMNVVLGDDSELPFQ